MEITLTLSPDAVTVLPPVTRPTISTAAPAAPAPVAAPAAPACNGMKLREAWLQSAAAALAPHFAAAGATLPPVHASVGFGYGSRGGKNILGQCWDAAASKDGRAHVFVAPTVDDSAKALGILAHELIHAAVGCAAGHGPAFARVAHALGMSGPARTICGGAAWDQLAAPILATLGTYPHAAIDLHDREKATGRPTQAARMLKFVCRASGYTVRAAGAWVRKYGPPISPVDGRPMSPACPDGRAAAAAFIGAATPAPATQ